MIENIILEQKKQLEEEKRLADKRAKQLFNLFPYVNIKTYKAKGDGVADDTEAFLAAITYLIACGGGILFLPLGIYLVSAKISIPDNIMIMGQGWCSWIKSPTLNDNVFELDGVSNVFLKDFKISGTNNPAHTTNRLIGIWDACSDILIERVYAMQSGRNAFVVNQTAGSTSATNIWFKHCIAIENQFNGFFMNGAKDSGIVYSKAINNGQSDLNGFGIMMDCYYQNICQDVKIGFNKIVGNGEGGLGLWGGKHIDIIFNNISENGESGWSAGNGNGIRIDVKEIDSTEMRPEHIYIFINTINKNYNIGLLGEGLNYSKILFNDVFNNAYNNSENRTGILLRPSDEVYDNCFYNKVFFNTVIRDDANSKQDFGIELLSNSGREAKFNIIGFNHARGNITASFNSDCQEQNVVFDMDDDLGLIRTRCFGFGGCGAATIDGQAKTTAAVNYEIQGKVYAKAATDNLWDLTGVSTGANEYKKVLLCLRTDGAGRIVEGKVAATQANALLPTLGRNLYAVVGVVEIPQNYSGGSLAGYTFYDLTGEYRR